MASALAPPERAPRQHPPTLEPAARRGPAPTLEPRPALQPRGPRRFVAPRRFAGVLKSMLGDRVTIVVIPNASHALFPEQPKAVTQAIVTFARRIYGM